MTINGEVKKREIKWMDFVHMAEKRGEGSSCKGRCLSCMVGTAYRFHKTCVWLQGHVSVVAKPKTCSKCFADTLNAASRLIHSFRCRALIKHRRWNTTLHACGGAEGQIDLALGPQASIGLISWLSIHYYTHQRMAKWSPPRLGSSSHLCKCQNRTSCMVSSKFLIMFF